MQKYKVTGVNCDACRALIGIAVEDWKDVRLVQEGEEHYLEVPEQFNEQIQDISKAVADANPSENYQVIVS